MMLCQVALTSHILLIEYLDEEEFGEAAESRTYDETTANSAIELGLLVTKPNFKKSNLLSSICFFFFLTQVQFVLNYYNSVLSKLLAGGKPRGKCILHEIATSYSYA
jgi:hypothetical protein